MSALVSDLRYAIRTWRRQPTLTIVALVTLALGTGANTAVFSVIKGVLLNPLRYPDPELLAVLWERDPKGASMPASHPTFVDWRDMATSLEDVAAFRSVRYAFKGREEPLDVPGVRATPELFDILRTQPALGRAFDAEHVIPGRDRVALISDGFWRRQFGADPEVIGRPIELDALPYTILGVMPAGFAFPPGDAVSIWTPLAVDAANAHDVSRGARALNVIARLAPGATFAQAEQELTNIATQLASAYPKTNQGWSVHLVPAREHLVRAVRPALLVVWAGVACLLLIVCANVASLMLARFATRRREMAVRASLGAERHQLIRQVLVESLALSTVGAAAGLVLALLALRSVDVLPAGSLPRVADVRVDIGVLAFTMGVSVVAALLFGVLPAVVASRADLRHDLQASVGTTEGASTQRLLAGLVVAEVAVALILLMGAGLLARSFVRLMRIDPGFATDRTVAAQLYLPRSKYREPHAQERFFEDVLGRLAATPGIESVGATSALPMHPVGLDFALPFSIDGRLPPADDPDPRADIRIVTPGYVETLRIPLLRGRSLDARDVDRAPHVMLINQTLARRYFGDDDPLGRFIVNPHGRAEVVGVVDDVHHYGLDSRPRAELYLPFRQNRLYAMAVVARSAGDARAAADAIRAAVAEVDPSQPIRDLTTLDAVLARSVFLPRFSMIVGATFAALAVLLAAVGIYGVLSYMVSRQRRDIGVRMALGAEPADARRLVLRRSAMLVGSGGLLGLALGVPAIALMRRTLATIDPFDPVVAAGVCLVLGTVALVAAYLPALRATRVDPVVALRIE